jgi:MFS family permease
MFPGPEWPQVILAALGLVGMSVAFPTVYLYSAELFPTVVRNVGVGSSSMCARVGSMVAPYITSLASYTSLSCF